MASSLIFSDGTLDRDVEEAIANIPIAHFSFPELDALLHGIRRNDFVIVGGAPGTGKTTFLNNLANDLARQGHLICFVSYEMKNYHLVAKSLAAISDGKLKESDIAGCHPSDDRYPALQDAKEKYKPISSNIVRLDDSPTIEHVSAVLQQMRKESGRNVILFCDYCQNVRFDNDENATDVATRTSIVADKLLRITLRKGFPCIAASAITRSAYDKSKAGVDCLSGTMKLEYNAASVIRLQRVDDPHETDESDDIQHRRIEASILKNRWGDLGRVSFDLAPEYATFREI